MNNPVTYPYQALTAMQKYQAVCASTDELSCRLALWPDQTHLSNMIGITTSNATPGMNTEICLFGILYDAAWDWIPFRPIFVGAGGYLTQTMPNTAVYQIAKALGPHTIFVSPSQFFLLNP